MADRIVASIVRILAPNEKIVGAGFLASERHVLTCAHVIAQGLSIPQNALEIPNSEIRLDFPLVAPGKELKDRMTL